MRQGVDKTQAALAFGGVATVDQDIAADVHVLADVGQHRAAGRNVVGRQVGVAQPQVTGIAVGNDLHRTDALMLAEVVGDLLQAVLAGVELNHLSARCYALEQAVGFLDPAIDEHHALPWLGSGRGCYGRGIVRLSVGILGRGRAFGGRRLRGIGRGLSIGLGHLGHCGRDRTVEQHSRLKGHDHRGCQDARALLVP
ncbi:hypothetical protein D3C80_1340560 [compost metagenome]